MKWRNGGRVTLRRYEFYFIVLVGFLCGVPFVSHLERQYLLGGIDFEAEVGEVRTTTPTSPAAVSLGLQEGQTFATTQWINTTANTNAPPFHNNDDKDEDDDWFHKTQWRPDLAINKCFYVEQLCHASQVWFYDPRPQKQKRDSNDPPQPLSPLPPLHQPYPLSLRIREESYPLYRAKNPYIHQIHVQQSPQAAGVVVDSSRNQCRYSPITNHMVLHSDYNDMLGEFYTRLFMGLWQIIKEIHHFQVKEDDVDKTTWLRQPRQQQQQQYSWDPKDPNNYRYYSTLHSESSQPWDTNFLQHTQMYLHLRLHDHRSDLPPPILESHRLFMDIFTSNPLLHIRALLDHVGGCRCMKRVIFCGYKRDPKVLQQQQQQNHHHHPVNHTTPSTTTGIMVAGGVGSIFFDQMIPDPTPLERQGMQLARQTLRHYMIDQNPLVQEFMQGVRYGHLKLAAASSSGAGQNHNHHQQFPYNLSLGSPALKELLEEWTIIGLSQRSTRRKWLDATDTMKQCNDKLNGIQIACVVVNIEDASWANPLKHLAVHAALDGLIGIHGAQLTEAVWMPSGSLVVELLPWNHPTVSQGGWTKWVHRPTPLGIIFKETDLNHIGLPLTVDSSADHECLKDPNPNVCFTKTIQNTWAFRDFTANFSIVEDIIMKFVVGASSTSSRPTKKPIIPSCEDLVTKAANDYVLYNVNCRVATSKTVGVHHFYRDEDWIAKKQAEARL
jgi:hypothetical protein